MSVDGSVIKQGARGRGAARPDLGGLPAWKGPLVAELALATRSEPFSGAGWVFELKYDGWRLLAAKNGDDVTLRLRSGRDATAMFPEVTAAVAALSVGRALLDGEVVVFSPDGRPDFEAVRARALASRRNVRAARATACLFDILALEGHDLRPVPLIDRKAHLRDVLRGQREIVYVDHIEGRGEELLAGARKLRLEGVVAKRADSAYPSRRSDAWRKFKVEETADFVVVGVAEPSRATFWRQALILATPANGRLRYVGRVGIGAADAETLAPAIPHLARPSPICPGAGRAMAWLEPALVCEVRFLASGVRGLRHAVFVRFRPEKNWRECASLT